MNLHVDSRRVCNGAVSAIAASTAIALLAGCGSGFAATPVAGALAAQSNAFRVPSSCAVAVWASSLSAMIVQGFTSAGAACGAPINGAASGVPLRAPFGLATDLRTNLYVADVNRSRIVAFTSSGTFLATMHTHVGKEPYGVCVSPSGVVAAVDRGTGSTPGDVEFFTNYNTPNPTGSATGVIKTFENCAFDKAGDFFADGSINVSGGGQKIVYLRHQLVNLPGQLVLDSGLGSAKYWQAMYVQLGLAPLLSVGAINSNVTYEIENFTITPSTGRPVLPVTVTALAGYPPSTDAFYQAAPNQAGANGTIYIADYRRSVIERAPVGGVTRPGGPVTPFASLPDVVGIATNPTGQL